MANSNDFTFEQVCKKLEISSVVKDVIMSQLNIESDQTLIDSATFDIIYDMQRESTSLRHQRYRVRKSKDDVVTISSAKPKIIEFGESRLCNICIKFHENTPKRWNENKRNPFSFEKLLNMLSSSDQRECYFQKQPAHKDRPRCTLFVIFSPDCCVKFNMGLHVEQGQGFQQLYYFFVAKTQIVAFPPHKDCVRATCKISSIKKDDRGIIPHPNVHELFQQIEKLSLPKADVNQERDKEIWGKYVEALRKLVYQKEQIWRVKHMSEQPYYTKDQTSGEEDTMVDVQILEKDLRKLFEKELADSFDREGMIDYGVNGKTAFLEFSGERDLSRGEQEKLEEMAARYFYELRSNAPIRTISCQLQFKYNDENIKDVIYPDIEQTLREDYQLPISVDADGRVHTTEKDARFVEKVINQKYSSILTLVRDNAIRHKVQVATTTRRNFNPADVQSVLKENGIERASVYFSEGKYLHIKVSTYIKRELFEAIGFQYVKRTNTYFSPNVNAPTTAVDGFYIEDGAYCVDNVEGRDIVNQYLTEIKDQLKDDSFRLGRTHYMFQYVDESDKETLRNFKYDVDEEGKILFNLTTSILTIYAADATEHRTMLLNIRRSCPDVKIDDMPYIPQFFIRLKGEATAYRAEVISTIQNALRLKNYDHIKYDSYRNMESTAVVYPFTQDDERIQFLEDLTNVCAPYHESLQIVTEYEHGTTLYEFVKNDRLVEDKERELRNNIRQASFKYYTQEEYNRLLNERKAKGEGYDTREGVMLGTLVHKEGDNFTFKITQEFLTLMDTKGAGAFHGGYIRPIFPGELTNISRMVHAMHKITTPEKDGFPANPNISNFIFDPTATRMPISDIQTIKNRILENLNEPLLRNQPKQLEAVAKALAAQDIAIIQGPPGTGKTTVIAEIIWQTLLANNEARILITSQTNLAVDNALERLKGKRMVRPIRIGNIEKFENEGKAYSDSRLRMWETAAVGSEEESFHKDNAIRAWIESVRQSVSDDAELAEPLKKWRDCLSKNVDIVKKAFSKQYNQNINIFAATCSECGSRRFFEIYNQIYNASADKATEPEFDLVIMDEASKATPPELVLPLTLGKKVIVIGDHKQLPPMIDSDEFAEALGTMGAQALADELSQEELKVSQFEKLFTNAPDFAITSLDTQFRMHEQIMNCISQFYEDQKELENGLVCGIQDTQDIPDLNNKASRWHGLALMPFIEPETHVIWVNVDTPEQQYKNSTSYHNEGEVKAIQIVLRALTKAEGFAEYYDSLAKEEDKEIGVITYYMSQMRAIRNALYPSLDKYQWSNFERFKSNNEFNIPFRINTVDRFQGMERNIVIVSTVRSNKLMRDDGQLLPNVKYPSALGFAKELQRINVGFSRAKRLLIVIGNKEHFSNKPEYAKAIERMKCIDIRQLENL